MLQTKFLRFLNKGDEKKFRDSILSFQRMCLQVLCLTLATQSSVIFIFNPLGIDLFQPSLLVIFVLMNIVLISIYFLYHKRYQHKADLIILSLVVAFISGSVEFFRNYLIERGELSPPLYFSFGVYLQTGCLYILIARIEWMKSSIVIIFLQIHIWIRAIGEATEHISLTPILLSMSIYLLILPLLCYCGEREDRLRFLNKQRDENHLAMFQSLITDVLPNAVVILNGENVTYFNHKTKQVLNISSADQLLRVLNSIKVLLRRLRHKTPHHHKDYHIYIFIISGP